jgi:phosphosulfolactate phosphohydrolase-like enzyme
MASILEAEKCAQVLGGGFQFGVAPEAIAQQLHQLADAVAEGDVIVQKATIYHRVSEDDFLFAGVVLQYAEKAEAKRARVADAVPLI